MENITYKLEAFEGPLDLLLQLIEKNKVKITDIPIALIFEQYMEYLDMMQAMDMEVAGEFIVMASELMLIKSKMLLPKAETETEDPREKLAAMLAEYQRMKQAAGYLAEHPQNLILCVRSARVLNRYLTGTGNACSFSVSSCMYRSGYAINVLSARVPAIIL